MNVFNSRDAISVLSFMSIFRASYLSTERKGGPAKLLFHYYMKKAPESALGSQLLLKHARFYMQYLWRLRTTWIVCEGLDLSTSVICDRRCDHQTVKEKSSLRQGQEEMTADFGRAL